MYVIPEKKTILNNAPVNYPSKKPDIPQAKTPLSSIYSSDTGRYRQLPVNSEAHTDILAKESEQKNTTNVNKHLKKWIDELLSYEKKVEASRSQIKYLLFDINHFLNYERNNIPNDYPHTIFIKKSLMPKLERVIENAQANRLFTFKFVIPEDFKKELAHILASISVY